MFFQNNNKIDNIRALTAQVRREALLLTRQLSGVTVTAFRVRSGATMKRSGFICVNFTVKMSLVSHFGANKSSGKINLSLKSKYLT